MSAKKKKKAAKAKKKAAKKAASKKKPVKGAAKAQAKSAKAKRSAAPLKKTAQRTAARKKSAAKSTFHLASWLSQAFELSRKKEQRSGEYFAAAANLVQGLPGCLLVNLYTVDLSLAKSTSNPSFSLIGFSQEDSVVFQKELNKYSFWSEGKSRFPWQEAKVFAKFYEGKPPFHLYSYQEEKFDSFVLGEKTSVFYQPLWSANAPLGSLAIAFERKTFLGTETLRNLQACTFIFTNVLLEAQFPFSRHALNEKQKQIEDIQQKSQKQIGFLEQESKEVGSRYGKALKEQQDKFEKTEQKFTKQSEVILATQKELEETKVMLREKNTAADKFESELGKTIEAKQSLDQELIDLKQIRETQEDHVQSLKQELKKTAKDKETALKQRSEYLEQKETAEQRLKQKEQDSTEELAQIQKESAEKLSQVQKESAEKSSQSQQESAEKLNQVQKESAEKLSQSQQESVEKLNQVQKESAEKLSQSQRESVEKLSQVQKESAEKLSQSQQESAEKFDKAEQAAQQKLKESHERSEQIRKELTKQLEQERQKFDEEFHERHRNLYQQIQEKENSIKQLNTQKREIEKELSQIQKASAKKQNEWEERAEKQVRQIKSLTDTRSQQKSEAQEKEKKLKLALSAVEQRRKEERQTYEKAKQAQERAFTEQKKASLALNQKYEDLAVLLEKERNKFQNLQMQEKHSQQEVQRQKEAFQQEKQEQKEQTQKALSAQKEAWESKLSRLAEYKQKLALLEEQNHDIKDENASLVEQRSSLLHQIEGAEGRVSAKDQEVKARETEIVNLKDLMSNLKNTVRLQSNEVQAGHKQRSSLEKEIGVYRDRQVRLEKTLFSINEEIRSQKLKTLQENQKKKDLEQEIHKRDENAVELRNTLQVVQSRLKKLELERLKLIQKEKRHGVKFSPIAELIQGFAKGLKVQEKIHYLYTNMPKDKKIDRILIYSLNGEHSLHLQGGYWNSRDLFDIKTAPFSLKESFFGQAFATLKPQLLKADDGFADADIFPSLKENILGKLKLKTDQVQAERFTLLIPLIAANSMIGLLTLASSNSSAFSQEAVLLFSDLAPLLAVALQQEKKSQDLMRVQKHNQSFRQVNAFLQERYMHITKYVYGIKQDLERQLPNSLKNDLMRTLEFPLDLVPPLEDIAGEEHLRFVKWIDILGNRARKSAGLDFYQDTSPETVQKLNQHIGDAFQGMYWLTSEAVKNVILHSQATEMRISLRWDNGTYKLAIVDNGDGIVRTSGNSEPDRGTGLRMIRNLANICGAQIEFGSDEQGRGLSVLVKWSKEQI